MSSVNDTNTSQLENNQDYQLVLSTVQIIKHQIDKATKDVELLNEIKRKALEDPVCFVDKLKNGHPLNLPRLQRIVKIPEIPWLQEARRMGLLGADVETGPEPDSSKGTAGDMSPTSSMTLSGSQLELSNHSNSQSQADSKLNRKPNMGRGNSAATVDNRSGRISGTLYLSKPTVYMDNEDAGDDTMIRNSREITVSADNSVHYGYQCDACKDDPIIGLRWTCQQCPDHHPTDLCDYCMQEGSYKTRTSISTFARALQF
ncbi:hypothetical protein BKA69DRAFT_1075720 [Paraphysoderma sedebokerense]|nr:hypothetical protein BKA69DRAFT_1075720 [Paraphysoderma sedebokerense]